MADEDPPRPRDREVEPFYAGLADEGAEREADAEPETEDFDEPQPLPPPQLPPRGFELGTACGAFLLLLLLIAVGSLFYLFIGD